MLNWQIKKIVLELKYTWKISRNSSDEKTNLIVEVSDGDFIGAGEAAPNIRYKELPENLVTQFELFLSHKPEEINSPGQLTDFLNGFPVSNALRFAIESAFMHFHVSKEKKDIHEFLEVKEPASISTSYSIPIMEIGAMKDFYNQNHLERFPFIKIKINTESGYDAIDHLGKFCQQPLIVDANEAYKDVETCIRFLEKIKKKKIEFIEQPMPASLVEESVYLKKYSPFKLFADESITHDADFLLLKKMFDGINMKLMKAGGYFNGIDLLKEARKNNMQTMIGCMVETTLGISSAMHLCSLADYVDLDSFLLIKNEPYKLAKERNGSLYLKETGQGF
jgi:L-alanine-DL-glutamate epimerase-like enolase superfamily enzyme